MTKLFPVISKKPYAIILPALLLSFVVYFWNLGGLPIQIFDESRYVNQAMEMAQNGNFWIPTYKLQPDHYATKPPLGIWLMVLSSKVFGATEFGFRIPSAVFAWLTGLLLSLFCLRNNKLWAAFLAPIILCTLPGFLEIHAARTADLDAPLAFFTTWFLLEWIEILQNSTTNKWQNVRMSLALTGALWIKGTAILLFGPGFLAIGLLYYSSFQKLLLKSTIYLYIVLPLLTILLYYCCRELGDHGYLLAVVEREIVRSSVAVEGHSGEWWFYLVDWGTSQWKPYILPIAILLFVLIARGHVVSQRVRGLFIFLVITGLVISIMESKVAWYDVPLYPALALFIALVCQDFYQKTTEKDKSYQFVFWGIVILLCGYGYKNALMKSNISRNFLWPFEDYKEEVYYHPKMALDSVMALHNTGYEPIVVFPSDNGYDDHIRFYLNQYKGNGHKLSLWWDNTRYWRFKTMLVPGELMPYLKLKHIPIKDTLAKFHNVYLLTPGARPNSIPETSFIKP